MLDKITEFVTGGLFKEIKDGVMSYFPPDMSPAVRAEIEQKTQELLHKKEIELNGAINESEKALNQRNAEHEGTTNDLRSIPVLGAIVIFMRGTQRPLWGFFTMYLDFTWFASPTKILLNNELVPTYTEQQMTALIIINILVLGFLFGERAIKNVMPLVLRLLKK